MQTVILNLDPKLFDDFDADENYNVEINFTDTDFNCEHDDCDEQNLPSISFLNWSPGQSVMTCCLAHFPAVMQLVQPK